MDSYWAEKDFDNFWEHYALVQEWIRLSTGARNEARCQYLQLAGDTSNQTTNRRKDVEQQTDFYTSVSAHDFRA